MSCSITTGIARGCKDNSGGVKRILLANVSSQLTFTEGATGEITAISFGVTGDTFYEFIPTKMSSNVVENVQSNPQNGTVGYEQVITMIFAKNQASLRNQVKLLGQGEVYAIVQDYNDKYFLYGEYNGMELTGGNSGSGTALTDLNGWTLTLSAMEPDPAKEVDSTIIAGLL